jgi:hypothetical protein
MSAQPSRRPPYSPEERAGYLAWKHGSTLDWSTKILVALNYPIAELRWFVDAVQGICKGKEARIAHSTLAKRAQRFKNKGQAKALAKSAIEANRDWSRLRRCLIFDIEPPKPHEREGKDKRARTLYTDYLTPAAVWAQETEQKIKKADTERWKKDSKYRFGKREEILNEALTMLPNFERVEDMPASTAPKENKPLSLSEYVEQRQSILLAENRRILDRVSEGDLYDADDIDERLAALEVYYARAQGELKESFESTRDVLIGLRKTRLQRAMDFTDIEEVMAPVDAILVQKGEMQLPPITNGIHSTRGESQLPLVAPENATQKGEVQLPPPPLAEPVVEATTDGQDIEEFVFEDTASAPPEVENLLTMEAAALSLAEDFKVIPNWWPDASGVCACSKRAECPSAGKHPILTRWDDPTSENCATNDKAKIRALWRKYPNANIGIATGSLGGIVVLDADFPKGGDEGIQTLLERLGLDTMPPTMEVNTGAGVHFYFKYDGEEIKNSASKLAPGVDVRGQGGQVISAPSVHRSGRRYMLANNLKPIPLPESFREEMQRVSKKEVQPVNTSTVRAFVPRAGTYSPSFVTKVFPEGERNDGIRDVSYGRWVNGWAADESDLVSQMLEVNATRCSPPLPNDDVIELARRTARNVARGERPRQGGTR